jgi:hypothetical protein
MRGPRDTMARESPRDSPVRESIYIRFLCLQVRSDSPSPHSITCHSANQSDNWPDSRLPANTANDAALTLSCSGLRFQ